MRFDADSWSLDWRSSTINKINQERSKGKVKQQSLFTLTTPTTNYKPHVNTPLLTFRFLSNIPNINSNRNKHWESQIFK